MSVPRHAEKVLLALVVLYWAHLACAFLPPRAAAPFVDTRALHHPITQDDYVGHYANAVNAADAFRRHGRLWYYDPYHQAGTLTGVFHGVDNHWAMLFILLFRPLAGTPLAFNMAVFSAYALVPVLAWGAAAGCGLGRPGAAFTAAGAALLMLRLTLLQIFVQFGGYGFVLATFAALWTCGRLARYLRRGGGRDLALLALAASLALFAHVLGPLVCLAFGVPLLVAERARLRPRVLAGLAAAAVTAVLVNLVWLAPLARFWWLRGSTTSEFQTSWDAFRRAFTTDLAFLLLFALFAAALVYLVADRRRREAAWLGAAAALLAAVCFLGTQLGLGSLQPGRFLLPLAALLLLGAGFVFEQRLLRAPLVPVLAAAVLLQGTARHPFRFTYGYPDPAADELLAFCREHVRPDARLHMQDSTSHPYFHSHLAAYLPLAGRFQLLAAAFTEPMEAVAFAQFVDLEWFGRPVTELDDACLREHLDLYNVRHLLVFGDTPKRRFDAAPFLRRVYERGRLVLYEYTGLAPSFCHGGQAEVEAGYDRLRVKAAAQGTTVLKFHYFPTLRAWPPEVRLRPVRLLDDPVPFLCAENGACREFVIVNGGGAPGTTRSAAP